MTKPGYCMWLRVLALSALVSWQAQSSASAAEGLSHLMQQSETVAIGLVDIQDEGGSCFISVSERLKGRRNISELELTVDQKKKGIASSVRAFFVPGDPVAMFLGAHRAARSLA